jgi:voltage-gated potassium channel
MPETQPRGAAAASLPLSLALVVLVATAIADWGSVLYFAIISGAIIPGLLLQAMFPSSRLLGISFVNLVAAYAAVFALFIEEAFAGTQPLTRAAGFLLPILAFLAGCWIQRNTVNGAIRNSAIKSEPGLRNALTWLAPVALVGAAVIGLSQRAPSTLDHDTVFSLAMALIAAIILAVSRSVAVFLVEIALLFEEFLQRVSHLLVPACAFLTVYALIVVVFAALYTITSKLGLRDHFHISGTARALSFPEALHFSITTLSTVGYGDIYPISIIGRSLAAMQVITGTLLLLFGVSEILEYSRERRRQLTKDPTQP